MSLDVSISCHTRFSNINRYIQAHDIGYLPYANHVQVLHALIEAQFKGEYPGSEAVKNKHYALHIVQDGTLLPLVPKTQLLPDILIVMSLEITLSAFTHFVWDADDSSFLAANCIRCKCSLEDMSSVIGIKGLPSPATWKW
jgi:hypothetical protein